MAVSGVTVTTAPPPAVAALPLFAPASVAAAPGSSWLAVLNSMRAAAGGLSVLDEQLAWSADATAAARCLSYSGQDGYPHILDATLPCGPGVSFEQAARGAAASLISFGTAPSPARAVFQELAQAPFHAMSMLHPGRVHAGFGTAYNPLSPNSRNINVNALNVGGGVFYGGQPVGSRYVSWPASGWSVDGTFRQNDEWPSPLWPCGVTVSGPPVWFMPAEGWLTARTAPRLAQLSLTTSDGRQAGGLCTFDGTTYTAPGQAWGEQEARRRLSTFNAVVVVPLSPLTAGSYVLRGTIDGVSFSKTFSVTAAVPLPASTVSGLGLAGSQSVPVLDTARAVGVPSTAPLAPATRVEVRLPADSTASGRVLSITAHAAPAAGQVLVSDCSGRVADVIRFASVSPTAQQAVLQGSRLCVQADVAVHLQIVQTAVVATSGAGFDPSVPVQRLLDTRPSGVPLSAQRAVTAGPGSSTVMLNVATVAPAGPVSVWVWACGSPRPLSPAFTAPASVTRATAVTVTASPVGQVCMASSRAVHVVVDRLAVLQPSGPGRLAFLAAPLLLVDSTRGGYSVRELRFDGRRLRPGEVYEVELDRLIGMAGVRLSAALVTVTASSPDAGGYVTVSSCPSAGISTLNVSYGMRPVVSTGLVPVSRAQTLCIGVSTTMHVKLQLLGYVS